MRIKYELSNYRCFPDSSHSEVVIAPGFTSVVGVNNSGKSTLLRSLFELRPLFELFGSRGPHYRTAEARASGNINQLSSLPLENVADKDDVFSDGNTRDMRISLSLGTPGLGDQDYPVPSTICIIVSRETKRLRTELTPSPHAAPLEGVDFGEDNILRLTDGGQYDIGPYYRAFESLTRTLYLGAFRNALNIGEGEPYYDLVVGKKFIKQWNAFKSGGVKKVRSAARQIEQDIGTIFQLDNLSIDMAEDGSTLIVAIGSQSYTLQELGSGLAQFVVVLAYVATRRPSLILIDEPETNLHPSLQVEFLNTLGALSDYGVMFATHSLGLARTASDRIYLARRIDQGESEIRPFEGAPRLPEILGELNFSGYRELGYNKILLVEGPSELRAIQRLLRLYRVEHQVVLVPLAGGQLIKGDVGPELHEMKRLTDDVYALVDSERANEGTQLAASRQAFCETCQAEGVSCHILERRALENYFSDRAVQAVKGAGWRGLGPYELPRDSGMSWSKTRDNWRIAGEVTREELDATDLGEFLSRLADEPTNDV
jgi:ABC-type cobalamin/Fe3+-siderophores transport system ATPase subunit